MSVLYKIRRLRVHGRFASQRVSDFMTVVGAWKFSLSSKLRLGMSNSSGTMWDQESIGRPARRHDLHCATRPCGTLSGGRRRGAACDELSRRSLGLKA